MFLFHHRTTTYQTPFPSSSFPWLSFTTAERQPNPNPTPSHSQSLTLPSSSASSPATAVAMINLLLTPNLLSPRLLMIFEKQSLSGTTEHDPEMIATITPAKRISFDMLLDHSLSEEMVSAQLSSTKITKLIKTE